MKANQLLCAHRPGTCPGKEDGIDSFDNGPIGETVTIRKITGKDEVRQHLAELGFVVDSTITVVSRMGGNLILQVKDSRIALDASMAIRIMI